MNAPSLLLWSALLTAQPGDPALPRITLRAQDADIAAVLEMLSTEHRLNLIAGKEVAGRVFVNLYDVPLEEALRALLLPNGFDFRRVGKFFYISTPDGLKRLSEEAKPEAATRVFRLNYVKAAEAEKLLRPLLTAQGKLIAGDPSKSGLAPAEGQSGGNDSALRESVLVVDEPDVLKRIEEALKELDRRPEQILVEATVVAVELRNDLILGVDFVALGGIDFNSIGGISNLQNVVHPPVSGDVLDRSLSLFRTDRFASDFPTDGLSVGFVKNNIGVFLEALATVTEVEVLANPKVLALNRQMAEIIVGGRLGYRTTTTTETATVQQVEFLETGTQLRFRPFVADDGFIRLEIHPENSTGSVDARTELPTKNTTEVTTNVLVRQGQTLVIGGLIEKQRNDIVKKVPILGDLPIAGALFRRTEKAEMRREILVLLTPRLIDPSRPEEADPGRLSLRDPGPRSRRYVARAGDLLRGNDLAGAYCGAGAAAALEPAAEAARLQEEIVNRWTAALLPTPPGGRP